MTSNNGTATVAPLDLGENYGIHLLALEYGKAKPPKNQVDVVNPKRNLQFGDGSPISGEIVPQ